MRLGFGGEWLGVPGIRRSTVARSKAWALRALSGIPFMPAGGAPVAGASGMPPILVLVAAGAPFVLATRKVVTVPPTGGPLGGKRSTMPPLLHPALPLSGTDHKVAAMVDRRASMCRIRMCRRCVRLRASAYDGGHKTRVAEGLAEVDGAPVGAGCAEYGDV